MKIMISGKEGNLKRLMLELTDMKISYQTFSDDEIERHCIEFCRHYSVCEYGEGQELKHGPMKACNLIEKLKARGR